MKLYLALKTYNSFDHGELLHLHGVFSSADKAKNVLEKQTWFKNSKEVSPGGWYTYLGQDSVYFEIKECLVDEELYIG